MSPEQAKAVSESSLVRQSPPKIMNWIAVELGVVFVLALSVPIIARSVPFLGVFPLKDALLLHGVYALCWGSLGASVNATMALAKHSAAMDFKDQWKWWYFTKPPLGAVLGLVAFILTKGLGAAVK
jgi:hypothetical protein